MIHVMLYGLSFVLFTGFIIYISIEYIFRKWKCDSGKCEKGFNGHYASEKDCEEKCVTPQSIAKNNSNTKSTNSNIESTNSNIESTNSNIEPTNSIVRYPDYSYGYDGYGYYPYYPTSLLYNNYNPYYPTSLLYNNYNPYNYLHSRGYHPHPRHRYDIVNIKHGVIQKH